MTWKDVLAKVGLASEALAVVEVDPTKRYVILADEGAVDQAEIDALLTLLEQEGVRAICATVPSGHLDRTFRFVELIPEAPK